MDIVFKKYFWIIELAVVSLLAWRVAVAGSYVIGANLAAFSILAPGAAAPSTDPLEESGHTGDVETAMSVFAPPETTPPLTPTIPETTPGPETTPVVTSDLPGSCVISSISAMLVGTMTDPTGDLSFGLVQDQAQSRTRLVRAGDELAGATVTRVEYDRLFVDNAGQEECLRSGQAAAAPSATATGRQPRETPQEEPATPREDTSERPSSSRSDSSDPIERISAGIERQGSNEYNIQRSAIEEAMSNPRALQSQAPEFEQYLDEGRPAGIRLTSIPSGSIFTLIGVRTGDILQEVNGQPITTPQRGMDLYDALQSESEVQVVVLRRGRQRTLTYHIQ